MQHLIGDKLPVIKTEKNEVLGSRAYTPEQVKVIAEHQNERNALATQLSLLVHLVYIALILWLTCLVLRLL
jgi:hypothetical protein